MIADYSFLPQPLSTMSRRYVFFAACGAWSWSETGLFWTEARRVPFAVWSIAPSGEVTHVAGPYADWEPAVARLRMEPVTKYRHLDDVIHKTLEEMGE